VPTHIPAGHDEIVTIAASKEQPKRISIGSADKVKVFYGSVEDSFKEVELGGKVLSVDVAQPVKVVGRAALTLEGLEPIRTPQGVVSENLESDVEFFEPKEDTKKDQKEVAEANEEEAIPAASPPSA